MDPIALHFPVIGFVGVNIYSNDFLLKYSIESSVNNQYSYITAILSSLIPQIISQTQSYEATSPRLYAEHFYGNVLDYIIA